MSTSELIDAEAGHAAARFWIHEGDQAPTSIGIDQGPMLIGRGDHCDLVLQSSMVSWDHAEVRRTGDAIVVADLGSRNGTWLNGRRLDRAVRLRHGDVVTIGDTRVELSFLTDHGHAPTVTADQALPRLTAEHREVLAALTAPFRAARAFAARPPTRGELAATLHLSERTVQRRLDELSRLLSLPPHEGRDRARLLAQRAIELGLDRAD